MSTRNFVPVDDGYTLKGYIAAKEGLIEAVRFTYRPIPVDMQAALNAALAVIQDTPNNPLNLRKRASILESRLVSWDLKDHTGEVLGINAANIRRFAPELFWTMFSIVFGSLPSDIDPEWEPDEENEEIAAALKALETGSTVGEVRDRENVKN